MACATPERARLDRAGVAARGAHGHSDAAARRPRDHQGADRARRPGPGHRDDDFDTDDLVLAALRHGAVGFLLKDTPPADLVDAVRRVAAGESTLSPSVTAQLIATVTGGADVRRQHATVLLGRLTEREREAAISVGRGLSNAEIAAQHFGRVFAKLGATTRLLVARTVHDAGLSGE